MMYSFLFRNEAKANGYHRCIGLEEFGFMNEEVFDPLFTLQVKFLM
jgi:hypothetical protein